MNTFSTGLSFFVKIVVAASSKSVRLYNSTGRRVVGGAAILNLTGQPIRSVRMVPKFRLWRETEKDGARAKPVHEKINKIKE